MDEGTRGALFPLPWSLFLLAWSVDTTVCYSNEGFPPHHPVREDGNAQMDLVGNRRHTRGRLRRSVRRRWAAGWWSAERDAAGVRRDGLGEGMDHPVREFDDEARQSEAAHQK